MSQPIITLTAHRELVVVPPHLADEVIDLQSLALADDGVYVPRCDLKQYEAGYRPPRGEGCNCKTAIAFRQRSTWRQCDGCHRVIDRDEAFTSAGVI